MANFGFSGGFGLGLITGNPLQYPLINGFSPSWASIEFKFAGSPIVTVQSIDYSQTNDSKLIYGTNSSPLSSTRGRITPKGKCKMLLPEAVALMAALGNLDPSGNNAFGDVFFDVNVTYTETGVNQVSDTLRGCRLLEVTQTGAEGSDAMMREFDLRPMQILWNGQLMSSQPVSAPQFP